MANLPESASINYSLGSASAIRPVYWKINDVPVPNDGESHMYRTRYGSVLLRNSIISQDEDFAILEDETVVTGSYVRSNPWIIRDYLTPSGIEWVDEPPDEPVGQIISRILPS